MNVVREVCRMHIKTLDQMKITPFRPEVKNETVPLAVEYKSEYDVSDESVVSFDYNSFGMNHHNHFSPTKSRISISSNNSGSSNPIDNAERENMQGENIYGYNINHNDCADRSASSHRRHDRYVRTRRGSTGSMSSNNSLIKAPKSPPANHTIYDYGSGKTDGGSFYGRNSGNDVREKPRYSRRMSNEQSERSSRRRGSNEERSLRKHGSNDDKLLFPRRSSTLEQRPHRQRRRNSLDNCSFDSTNKIKTKAPRRRSNEERRGAERKTRNGDENAPRRRNSLEMNSAYGSNGEKSPHQRRNSIGRTMRRGRNERNPPRNIDENVMPGRVRNSRQALGNAGESIRSIYSKVSGSSSNSPKQNRMKLNNASIDSELHTNTVEIRHNNNNGPDLRYYRGSRQNIGYKRSGSNRRLVDYSSRNCGNVGNERIHSAADRGMIASPRMRMRETLRSSRRNSERNLENKKVCRNHYIVDGNSYPIQRHPERIPERIDESGFDGYKKNISNQSSSPQAHSALLFPGRNIRRRSAPDMRIHLKDTSSRKKVQRPSSDIRQTSNFYEQNKLLQDVSTLNFDFGFNSEEEDEMFRSYMFMQSDDQHGNILDQNKDAPWVRRRRMRGTTGISRRLSQ